MPFTIMTKPIGPICNIDCEYCYYLEKDQLYPKGEPFKMTEPALESYIRQVIASSPGPQVDFMWQGGEPTLLGLDFFRRAVEIQQALLPKGWSAANALQTNGTLLTEEWCRFLRRHQFLVGISIDGPAALHDRYRVDKGGRPTHHKVMRGLKLLQAHGVEYNVLCTVHAANAEKPLEVYRFFKEIGATWLQFIPIVEHAGGTAASERSVGALQYGKFMSAIFDEWIRYDVGRIYVQLFETCLGVWYGRPASLCIFAETCGRGLALEHNGDLYACDHFVDPEHKLGNIHFVPLAELVDAPEQVQFGLDKRDKLPAQCRRCDVRFMCNGGCPKERFLLSEDGEPGLNYLCEGYQHLFRHVDPYMKRMTEMLRQGVPPWQIMTEVRKNQGGRR